MKWRKSDKRYCRDRTDRSWTINVGKRQRNQTFSLNENDRIRDKEIKKDESLGKARIQFWHKQPSSDIQENEIYIGSEI